MDSRAFAENEGIQFGVIKNFEIIGEAAYHLSKELNDGINAQGKNIANDLNTSVEGYRIMGERFAEKAIQLSFPGRNHIRL